jgi:hypothetical protein
MNSKIRTDLFEIMHTKIYLKGGDFMGLENEVSRMIWEGSPISESCGPTIKNSRFPEVAGRTRLTTALEIAETIDLAGRVVIDPVVFRSVSNMEAGQ